MNYSWKDIQEFLTPQIVGIEPTLEILISTWTSKICDAHVVLRATLSNLAWFFGTSNMDADDSLNKVPFDILDLDA